jgi:hypothetical protein
MAIIPSVVSPMGIRKVIVVIDCANVLGEKKVQRPVKCHANLFVQAGQLAQIDCPPHPPCEEAREIEAENPRYTHATTDRSQQPNSFE